MARPGQFLRAAELHRPEWPPTSRGSVCTQLHFADLRQLNQFEKNQKNPLILAVRKFAVLFLTLSLWFVKT
jgi:hypothetical protein